jgi:hypothetical protein
MKKIVLLSFVCALFSLGAVAQEKPSFFVKAGVNASDFRYSDVAATYNARAGFRAGFGAILPVSNLIAIQPSLYLSQKGAKRDDSGYVTNQKGTIDAWYLDLPIDLQFRIHAGKVVLTPAIGPYFAYGVFGKIKNDNTGDSGDTFQSGGMKKFDCGLNIEFGVEFSNNIMLSIGYQEGLTKVGDVDDAAKIYNETFNFSVGYKF